ncbi:MAG: hypothetical protein ACW99U_06375 [Candidatus Thorarchaeota archaeon]|jgi:hypothetical protein
MLNLEVLLEWNRRTPDPAPEKVRFFSDEKLISEIARTHRWPDGLPKFDWTKIEETINPILEKKHTISEINNVLGASEVRILPRGDTPLEQIESLIPENVQDLSDGHRNSLKLCLARIVRGAMPNDPMWLWFSDGLDHFTAATFLLHSISQLTCQHLPWLEVMHEPKRHRVPIADLQLVTLRPDGPECKGNLYLTKIRGILRSLLYEPLVKTCVALVDKTRPTPTSASLVSKVTNLGERRSRTVARNLELLMTERFVPNLPALGLRYRYLCQTSGWWRYHSAGLERYLETPHAHYQGIEVHVEPVSSEGPSEEDKARWSEWCMFTADTDIVSMNMGLFDKEKRDWSLGGWKDPVERDDLWIIREHEDAKSTVTISERTSEVFGLLWGHQGSRASRIAMFTMMDYPRQTLVDSINSLLDKSVMSVLYHPALEYTGLPEMVFLAMIDAPPKSVLKTAEWLMAKLPFVHLRLSKSKRNLAAHIRVPERQGGTLMSFISREIEPIKCEKLLGVVRRERSMTMTLPFRMATADSHGWRDPWATAG